MARRPLAALCCYDARVVGDRVLGDLCAVHPCVLAGERAVPFRLYHEDGAVKLAGELDFFSLDRLRRALAGGAAAGDVLDLAELEFVDHPAAIAVVDSALELRGMPKIMRRVLELMGRT
jgi:anti-anti-sigma regulatory factor